MQGKGGGDDLIIERGQYAVHENTYVDNNTGDLIPYDGWESTDYIDVSQGYALSRNVDSNYTAFYDEQKNRIGNALASINNATNVSIAFIMPNAKVKFMRISYQSYLRPVPVVYTVKAGALVIK